MPAGLMLCLFLILFLQRLSTPFLRQAHGILTSLLESFKKTSLIDLRRPIFPFCHRRQSFASFEHHLRSAEFLR